MSNCFIPHLEKTRLELRRGREVGSIGGGGAAAYVDGIVGWFDNLLLVALMMEGKFSGEGLQSFDTDEDLMSAMARELVEKAGVGESADQIWRQLDQERSKHTAAVPTAEDGSQNIEPVAHADPAFDAGIHLVHSAPRKTRKNAPPWPTTTTAEGPKQLSLFG